MNKKSAQLRNLLSSPSTEFIMEAHNGMSAKVVEEAGFSGIWGSGLAISSSLGVRDSNEASWTQVVDVLEFMSDATSVPILMDADTGFGNFNNVRRLVRKLEQIEVGGLCLEDKLFPKTNSFIDSESQQLANPDEFAGKIRAAKDSQTDGDFCVVARLESLIVGHGMDEALRRAEKYHAAGADAILVHSKKKGPEQVLEFAELWDDRCPLVVVPTTYFHTPAAEFERVGISLVIWGNHMMRAAIRAMQHAAKTVYMQKSVAPIDADIVSVAEIFRLQDAAELKEAEARYLPGVATQT